MIISQIVQKIRTLTHQRGKNMTILSMGANHDVFNRRRKLCRREINEESELTAMLSIPGVVCRRVKFSSSNPPPGL